MSSPDLERGVGDIFENVSDITVVKRTMMSSDVSNFERYLRHPEVNILDAYRWAACHKCVSRLRLVSMAVPLLELLSESMAMTKNTGEFVTIYEMFLPIVVATYGCMDLAEFLISLPGFDVNHKYKDHTMLYYAVKFRQMDMVRFLLDHGADVNSEDNGAIVTVAVEKSTVEIFDMLYLAGSVIPDHVELNMKEPAVTLRFFDLRLMKDRDYALFKNEFSHVVSVHNLEMQRRKKEGTEPLFLKSYLETLVLRKDLRIVDRLESIFQYFGDREYCTEKLFMEVVNVFQYPEVPGN